MTNEIIGLIAVLVLLQFAVSILHPSLESVGKTALSALAILSVFGILLSMIGKYELPEFTYADSQSDEYSEVLTEATARGIALEVASKYKINEEKISVSIRELDTTKMRAGYIYLRIDDVRADYRSIREFVSANFLTSGGNIEVVLTEQ